MIFRSFSAVQGHNSDLELSRYEKFNVCCFWIVKNVILGTQKKSAIIFGKAIRPNVFGNGQKSPNKFENTQAPPA